ncbi:putative phage protein [Herminiimonas arsenicoxydans]|uniref:Phage protein n=1 Tax=Herminiimonas arsenicoxydans TaxID=204773 RepID=A4G5A8_HERAR|nr:putative phage protein [Herminiimonas arsenicoxydans]
MAVYAITGKLGSGKGKAAIQRLREYMREGKRVATNCDVFLEHLMPKHSRGTITRVPDKPTAYDLYAIGSGNKFIDFEPLCTITSAGNYSFQAPAPKLLKGFDEAHNGALVLDECGSWLNARTFGDNGRADMLEWCIHARKYGWDVFFVMQNISQIDKQLRESLFEYVVRLNRLDRMKIPVLSPALKLLTAGATKGTLPRVHIAVVRLGSSIDGLVADRWIFRGDDLNDAYNTTQVFSSSYPHAIHCLLPNWHREGYLHPEPVPFGIRLVRRFGFMLERKPRKAVMRTSNRFRDLVMQLPAEQRVKHFQRLQQHGVI